MIKPKIDFSKIKRAKTKRTYSWADQYIIDDFNSPIEAEPTKEATHNEYGEICP